MGCRSIKIEGIENITVNQGVDVDLMDGVHAYDSNLDEIDVSVSPSEIDSCDVGTHTVTYKATGVDDGQFGVTTCIEPLLHAPNLCNYRTIQKSRTIEVLSVDPPVISGIDDESIEVGGSLDLLSGVSAIDANGNTVDVSYSGEINELASGEIASFETDLAKPLQSLTVNLDPIQDLNGYDSPWVGGAGKNKYPITIDTDTCVNNGNATHSGSNGVLTVNFAGQTASGVYFSTASQLRGVINGSADTLYISFDVVASGSYSIAFGTSSYKNETVSTTKKRVFYEVPANNTADFKLYQAAGISTAFNINVSNFMVSKSSDITYSPYSNICPISGHTECVTSLSPYEQTEKHTITGKNLYNAPNNQNGVLVPCHIENGQTVVTSCGDSGAGIRYYNANKTQIDYWTLTLQANGRYYRSFTASGGIEYVEFYGAGSTNYMIEVGVNAPSPYEPYGTSHTTALGRTVYGGTLDVVSGELADNRQTIQFDDASGLTFQKNATTGNWWATAIKFSQTLDSITDVLCDCLTPSNDAYNGKEAYTCRVLGSGRVYISLSSEQTSNADCQTWLAEYKPTISAVLSQPQTYQLTPQQINTLLGQNKVWSEQGSVAVVYARSIQNRSETFDVEGLYEITYTAEDKCGNERISVRTITVGDLSSTE